MKTKRLLGEDCYHSF